MNNETAPENTSTSITQDFPCAFSVKVIGKGGETFESLMQAIFTKHFPGQPFEPKKRDSTKQNFTALTITIQAETKKQLDTLYQELTNTPEVLMAL